MYVQVIFLKILLKFKMAATDPLQFFCGRKNIIVKNYSNSTVTFPTICRYASDFLNALLKFRLDKLEITTIASFDQMVT